MSQAALAEQCGFKNQSAIGNLENRETGRGGFSLPKIAEVLDVPLQWLLDGPDSDQAPVTTETSSAPVVREPTASYSTHDKAVAILGRLAPTALREALQFLEFLEAKQTAPSSHGADLPVPAPKRRAA